MFFSTNSNTKNGHDPFSFLPDHSFHLPISFFPFPSPFEVEDQFDEYDFMFHQSHNNFTTSNAQNNASITIPSTDLDKIPTNTNTNMGITNSDQKKKIPRKRLSKKDRHSKITTARGLRDRRMRLSLPVARQFFGLQDMLGVDKGSKTVEWLLIQARPEILKLAKERNCSSSLIMSSFKSSSANFCSNSNSEGDMVSGIDEVGVGGAENGENFVKKMKSLKSDGQKKKRVKQPRKTMAKEMREMARARARARTMEKKNQIRDCSISDFDNNNNHHDLNYNNFNKISSCSWSSPFETGEESGATHSYNLNPAIEVEKPMTSQFGSSSSSQQPIIDYQLQNFSSFEIMAKWSPSDSTFNYLHQTENLDLQEQNEFEDSDIFG